MVRWLRRAAIGSAFMLVGAAIAVALLYRAATAPVPEYQAVIEATRRQMEAGDLDQKRQELESQLAALYSDAGNAEAWETVLTADQMNSWFATKLDEVLPELAEEGLSDLRVLINPGVVTLALRATRHGVDAVVALDVAPFVAEDGSLALELSAARIGTAPLPTAQVFAQLQAATGDEGLPGRWTQNDGRPVLLQDISWAAPTARHTCVLEVIEVRDGEVYVAGRTEETTPHVAALP
ncbi:MAG: hypothetical protein AAGJ46_04040 [Planctomycetota bacterium]